MSRLEEQLRHAGRRTARVNFPYGDDASCVAVADLLDNVNAFSELPPPPRRQLSVLTQLDRGLSALPAETVLFIDEPPFRDVAAREPTVFDERAAAFDESSVGVATRPS